MAVRKKKKEKEREGGKREYKKPFWMTIIEYIDNVDDFTSYTRSVKIENHGQLPSTANVAIGNLIKIATNLSLPVLRLTYILIYIHT